MPERPSAMPVAAARPARGAAPLPARNRRTAIGLVAWIVLLMLLSGLVAWLKN